jgi:hypothetical protein
MSTSDNTTKCCSYCKNWFPATRDHFVRDKTKPDGFHPRCHDCKHKRRDKEIFPDGFSRCTKCKDLKSIDCFSFNKGRGRPESWCKECHCQSVKDRYIPSPRELVPPEEKKRRKAKLDAAYRERNREKLTAYFGHYYVQNRDRICQRSKDWARNNQDRVRANNKRRKAHRRAREIAAEGFFTAKDVLIAYRSQRGKCWHCFKHVGINYHADHLIPLNRGGTNWPNNIVISCPRCNLSKGAKLTQEWNGRLF